MYSKSLLFFEAYRCHRVMKLILKLDNWRCNWQLAENELSIFSTKIRILCLKKCMTSWSFFGVYYTDDQKLSNNMAIFDFGLICVEDEGFKDTETTTWTGKHIPYLLLISSNLIQELIFLCNRTPPDMVSSSNWCFEFFGYAKKNLKWNKLLWKKYHNKKWLARVLEITKSTWQLQSSFWSRW